MPEVFGMSYPAAGEACYICGYRGGEPPIEGLVFCSEGAHHSVVSRPLTPDETLTISDAMVRIVDGEIFRILLD